MIAHGTMAFNSPRAPKASPSSVPRILVLLESFDSRPAPDAHLKLSMIVREVDLSLERDLGMAVTSELNTNPGLCAFVRLYPRNLDEMGFLEESIKKQSSEMKSHSITFLRNAKRSSVLSVFQCNANSSAYWSV